MAWWRSVDGKVLTSRRHALWEALIISPSARQALGKDHWCEEWRILDSDLAIGCREKAADDIIAMAGITRSDN